MSGAGRSWASAGTARARKASSTTATSRDLRMTTLLVRTRRVVMRKSLDVAVVLLAFLALAVPALAQDLPAPLMAQKAGDLGTVLTGPTGMTLYTFKNDTDGKSVCNGPCAESWPPFKPAAGAAGPKAPLGG